MDDSNSKDTWAMLILGAARGDEDALRDLHHASAWMVFGLALSILRDTSEADEVVLDVYLQVWQQATRFEPKRGTAKAWLKTIARSRALDRARRGARRGQVTVDLDRAIAVPAQGNTPEGEILLGQKCHRLRRALNALASEQREAIELAFLSGLTQVEVAGTLDVPLGTVKSRIRMGLAKLRNLLEDVA